MMGGILYAFILISNICFFLGEVATEKRYLTAEEYKQMMFEQEKTEAVMNLQEQHLKENLRVISKKDVEAFKNSKSLESNTSIYVLDDKEFTKLTKKIRKSLKDNPKIMDKDEYMDVLKRIRTLEKIFS